MKMRSAPSSRAEAAAIRPTGPAPKIAMLAPGPTSAIGGFAGREHRAAAKEAGAARNGEGHDHAITAPELCHSAAGVFDDTHEFVAEDVARLHGRDLAAIDVQV